MLRENTRLHTKVRLTKGAHYPDKTPIPLRFFDEECTVLGLCGNLALLYPLMRYVSLSYLVPLEEVRKS